MKMNINQPSLIMISILNVLLLSQASAIGLGGDIGRVYLGQKFDFNIPITSAASIDKITAKRITSDECRQLTDATMCGDLTQRRFTATPVMLDGKPFIHIYSDAPVSEPYIVIGLRVEDAGGSILKTIPVLPDVPVDLPAPPMEEAHAAVDENKRSAISKPIVSGGHIKLIRPNKLKNPTVNPTVSPAVSPAVNPTVNPTVNPAVNPTVSVSSSAYDRIQDDIIAMQKTIIQNQEIMSDLRIKVAETASEVRLIEAKTALLHEENLRNKASEDKISTTMLALIALAGYGMIATAAAVFAIVSRRARGGATSERASWMGGPGQFSFNPDENSHVSSEKIDFNLKARDFSQKQDHFNSAAGASKQASQDKAASTGEESIRPKIITPVVAAQNESKADQIAASDTEVPLPLIVTTAAPAPQPIKKANPLFDIVETNVGFPDEKISESNGESSGESSGEVSEFLPQRTEDTKPKDAEPLQDSLEDAILSFTKLKPGEVNAYQI